MAEADCTMICLVKEMGISWNAPLAYGVLFLNKLRDCLWYIDGHHDAIAEKAPKLPQLFACFTGYNCPEHRKRVRGNLSMAQLRTHSGALQKYLQSSWFKKEQVKALKEATEGVVATLSAYSAYLQEKSKSQKLHHAMSCPSASPSDFTHLEHLPRLPSVSSNLQPIDHAVRSQEAYMPISVADFTPLDRRQRYR